MSSEKNDSATQKGTSERQMVGKHPAYNKLTVISTETATRNKNNAMFHRVFARTDLNRASDSHISSYLVSNKRQAHQFCYEIADGCSKFLLVWEEV
jgi:hypothetical protein